MSVPTTEEVDVERIAEAAVALGTPLPPGAADRLAAFGRLFLTWNARINLGGAISAGELVDRHFVDSFAVARFIPPESLVVDVGSGGGLPALPLAVLRPDLRLHLFEPTGKKVAFLRTATRELGLKDRIEIHAERVVASGPRPVQFDVAMSRATLPPADWLGLGRTLIGATGLVVVFATGPSIAEEGPPSSRFGYASNRWVLVYSP